MRTVRLTDHRGLRWEVEEAYEEALRARLLPRLDELSGEPGVDVVKRNRVRTVLRLDLEGPRGAEEVYLKRYHAPGVAAALKGLVRPSRARQEWDMARAFEETEVRTAHPIAWAEVRRFGFVRDAAYLCRGLRDATDFVPWILSRAPDPADVSDRLRRRHFLQELAVLTRRQHDLGLDHPDLHSGNILLVPDEDDRDVSLHVIDLHGAFQRRHPLSATRRMRLLAKLLQSLLEVADSSDRYRFLRDYAAGRENPLPAPRDAFRIVEARVKSLEETRLRSRSKRCLKRTSRFDIARRDGWTIHHLRSQPGRTLLDAVAAHDRALAEDGRVIKRGKRGSVTLVRIPDRKGERTVVVKESRPSPPRAWLGGRLGRLRGRRGWVLGNALLVREVDAATPLGYLRQGRGPIVRREILVMEDVSRDGERLDHRILRRYREEGLPVEERRELISEVATFVRRLHRAGIYHGDLKACNLFVQIGEDGDRRIRVVDYDRVRLDRPVDFRRRVKNLAQLSASIPTCVSRSDRLRFFRRYAPTAEVAREWKRHARGVIEECRSKIVVGMEPIE